MYGLIRLLPIKSPIATAIGWCFGALVGSIITASSKSVGICVGNNAGSFALAVIKSAVSLMYLYRVLGAVKLFQPASNESHRALIQTQLHDALPFLEVPAICLSAAFLPASERRSCLDNAASRIRNAASIESVVPVAVVGCGGAGAPFSLHCLRLA